jgi:hypothetical protein
MVGDATTVFPNDPAYVSMRFGMLNNTDWDCSLYSFLVGFLYQEYTLGSREILAPADFKSHPNSDELADFALTRVIARIKKEHGKALIRRRQFITLVSPKNGAEP